MKNKYIFLFILFGSLSAAGQIDTYIGSYTGANANGYLQPLADVLTTSFNTGQVQRVSIDSGFHLYFGIIANASFITSDKLKFFDASTTAPFLPAQTAKAPTIMGPSKSVNVPGVNGTVFTFPAGFDARFVTLAVPQLTIGNILGTEFTGRFFAYDTKDELGKISLWAAGLRHDIGQYFLKDPVWKISVAAMTQRIKTGNYSDLKTLSAAVYAGRQSKTFHYFAFAGYQKGDLSLNYTHDDGEKDTIVHVDLKNNNSIMGGIGAGLKLGVLNIQTQMSGPSPINLSLGIGVQF